MAHDVARRDKRRGWLNVERLLLALLAALAAVAITRLAWSGMASAEARPRPVAPPRAPRIRLRPSDLGPPLIAGYTLCAFLSVNYVIPGRLSADANLYMVQPAMWGGLAVLSLLFLWRGTSTKMFSVGMAVFGIWAAGFQVAAQIGMGLLYGFGHSPYAREPLHMLENGLYLTTLIAGVECSRAYLIARFYKGSPFATLLVVSVLFALILVPTGNYHWFGGTRSAFQLTGETLMPAFATSVLASYLAARGGFVPAFIYHGGILAFEWFSPILPHMEWTVAAFVGTTAPLVALMTARSAGADEAAIEAPPEKFDVSAPWVIAMMFIVALLWFNTGLLGVKPEIVTGVSMEPAMHTGDLVIVKDVDVGDLRVGDVIQFKTGQTRVFHRLIEIEKTPEGYALVTQGDNNNTPDDPIVDEQVEGKVVLTVPDAGWVPIKIKQFLQYLQ